MKPLYQQSCQQISKDSPALASSQINQYLTSIPQWVLVDNKAIERDFKFSDYHHTMAFVNAVAEIAHQEDHHPDLEVSYNHCKVIYTTHAVNGLSMNDFICAAKIDRLDYNE
ncbi:MAG: 4a-hydroxytetrahydrobiopterin dehydratase [Gammaproteobacteria bacterium]|jgi:4a-hydroxytetrahydrobiopterin dehydratase